MEAPHVCNPTDCPETGGYYVTAIDGDRYFLMAGPYKTHPEALTDVDKSRDIANEHDGRAWFMAWGTSRKPGAKPGSLNRAGLLKGAAA